ncbi:MAG TPA: ABC transporter permease, partial [Trebonia sp.]
MARWIIDRLLQMVVVLICATLLGFLLVRLLKGNEIFALLGDNYTPQAAAQLNHELGLDKPLPLQYLDWLGGAVHGDFGTSVTTHEPVAHSLLAALGPTAELLVGAQLVALLLTLLVTVVSVRWRWSDRLVTGFALLCSSVPPFVLGLLMIILFASVLHLLPAIAWSWPSAGGWGKNFRGMIMPWVALGV